MLCVFGIFHVFYIHVAGTNGKGSVAVKVANCLKQSGLKTGLYTSPHISSFRERVQINNEIIAQDEVEVSWLFGLTDLMHTTQSSVVT